MEASVSPISTPSFRESPSYVPKSHPNSLSPGRDLTKVPPLRAGPWAGHASGTSSTPASRTVDDSNMATTLTLTSAKHLQRSIKSEKRKDTARRRLMGTMYSKQNEVSRSFTFVAGERPQTELKFPTVSQSYLKTKEAGWQKSRERPKSDTCKDKVRAETNNHERGAKNSRRAHSHKVSLPEIIMEFNLEASMAMNQSRQDLVLSRAETEEDERALGVPYEDMLNKPKYVTATHNPCRAKYRPVTPGLLESLNKSKVPSKVKTEQWVRSIQTGRKSYCGTSYKIGNLDNANLATPNWIYEYR